MTGASSHGETLLIGGGLLAGSQTPDVGCCVSFSPLLTCPWEFFLSEAQPTDQGEESVVLVVVVGGLFFDFPCTVFWEV